jgi:hypothetical protein
MTEYTERQHQAYADGLSDGRASLKRNYRDYIEATERESYDTGYINGQHEATQRDYA